MWMRAKQHTETLHDDVDATVGEHRVLNSGKHDVIESAVKTTTDSAKISRCYNAIALKVFNVVDLPAFTAQNLQDVHQADLLFYAQLAYAVTTSKSPLPQRGSQSFQSFGTVVYRCFVAKRGQIQHLGEAKGRSTTNASKTSWSDSTVRYLKDSLGEVDFPVNNDNIIDAIGLSGRAEQHLPSNTV
ncbi:hypothetical protein CHS0354_014469 [Potamilus streckersoni]|uniref:Uncharacterized protein n=1 Tax=Potamilus streckersoni TaxID=2493646 RepID=A0AAE0VRX9_9BIVA|nr:hypothetical protein CHS0354_014469 [Potamilus streckersoni]